LWDFFNLLKNVEKMPLAREKLVFWRKKWRLSLKRNDHFCSEIWGED